jgi:hypothetical protein
MTAGNIGDNIIAVIGARNDPVLAGSDTAAAVAPPRRGGLVRCVLSVRSGLPRPSGLKRTETATRNFRVRPRSL